MNVLIVEDDKELNDTIAKYLKTKGYNVFQCFDTSCAKKRLDENGMDMLVLDVKLPRQSGFEFLEKNSVDIPTIYITSLNSIEDIKRGFESGAADYIKKPFHLKELLLRIEALSKKRPGIKIFEECRFIPSSRVIEKGSEKIYISPTEASLLELLLKRRGEIVTLEELLEIVPSKVSLRTYIKKLRKLLTKESIETIKEVGYRFVS